MHSDITLLKEQLGKLGEIINTTPKQSEPGKLLFQIIFATEQSLEKIQTDINSSEIVIERITSGEEEAEPEQSLPLEPEEPTQPAPEQPLESAAEESDELPNLTLDDVAMLFVQLEPTDRPGLVRVRDGLNSIAADESYPASVQTIIAQAAEQIDAIIQEDSSDPDEHIAEAGRLMEAAMDAVEGDEQGMPTPPPELVPEEIAEPAAEAAEEEQSDYLPEDADPELLAEFITECRELTESAETALLSLETNPEDTEAVNTVFRAFHTIKGTAGIFELNLILELAHHAESLLSRVRDQEISYTDEYADLALRSVDIFKEFTESIQNALGGGPMTKPDGYDDLMQLLADAEGADISSESDEEIEVPLQLDYIPLLEDEADSEEIETTEKIETIATDTIAEELSVEELRGATAVQDTAEEQPVEPEVEVMRAETKPPTDVDQEIEIIATDTIAEELSVEELRGATAVQATAEEQPIEPEVVRTETKPPTDVDQTTQTRKSVKSAKRTADSSVRVRTDRLDSLIDMVGELVIAHSMVAQDETVVSDTHLDFSRKVNQTGKIVRELQDLSMSMRMVPMKATFQKMNRLVRDLARKVGKSVNFITEGEDTEIDRNMVDVINDPLVHMVRNAVDHGIEPPDVREQNGKPREGTVHLSAYHSGGSVVVEIQDDGKGLDRDKIIKKAISKELIESDKSMSDNEIYNLIFAPGFSTAEQVTNVSGRGVGLDVVKKGVEALRGRIDVSSELGKGCAFSLKLPLTLAITDGMLVKVGDQRYILPTINIHISFRPDADALSTIAGRGEMVMYQEELMPIFRLHRLFDSNGNIKDLTDGLLVIVEDGDKRCALLVDELLGQQQVVAKPLGDGIGKIQGIAGGAILGDSRVGLILDTPGIITLAKQT